MFKKVSENISNTPTSPKTWMRELVEFALLIVLVILPFRIFIAEPYIVSGISMSPTYETGHYLIINKFWHKLSGIDRGDVLVFQSPNADEKFYIKRAIGLPGETVSISNQVVSVTPVGATTPIILDEPYLKDRTFAELQLILDEEEYFMMGDNRGNSFDSRAWGPLPADNIRGEPFLRLFPFSLIGIMPGRGNITY